MPSESLNEGQNNQWNISLSILAISRLNLKAIRAHHGRCDKHDLAQGIFGVMRLHAEVTAPPVRGELAMRTIEQRLGAENDAVVAFVYLPLHLPCSSTHCRHSG